MGDVVKFLKKTKIEDLFQDDKTELVSGKTSDPALVSLKKLLKAKVLSIPLYDEKAKAYTAFFDIIDVLHFVTSERGGDGSMEMLEGSEEFKKYTSAEVANLSGDNHFVPIPSSQPLVEAMEVMTHDYSRLHRLPVVDKDGKLIGILSQSRLVRFLGQHVSKFDFGSLSIKQTHLGVQKVISVTVKDRVSKALEEIKEKKVSAVAVVDETGVLVGNFSATDLKLLGYDNEVAKIAGPDQTLGHFVNKVKKGLGDKPYPIAVESKATTSSVISTFTKTGVHRIYIVDGNKKPIGIISLVDVIELFVRHILIE
jgi:CBS domain-containing protein